MEDDTKIMSYVSRCQACGFLNFATVDRPEYAKDTAKEIAKIIRRGASVERMPVPEVRAAKWCDCGTLTRTASQETLAIGN